VKEAVAAVEGNLKGRNFKSGENLYHAAACASCHSFAGQGMGIGPDLTGSANRYSLEDMMENIILPSKVISDQYVSTEFKMKVGPSIKGRIAKKEDGMIHLMMNPYSADITLKIKEADVESSKLHETSDMPAGMINSLNADELSDLIAYIFSAGDEGHAYFATAQYQPEIEGAKSLFNGKDLSGWKGDADLWSVKDGVIHGSSHDKKLKGNTFLILESEDIEDFHLVYEARCFGNNSGVMYRSEVLDVEKFVMKGSQCDLHPNPPYLAMLYGEKERGIVTKRGETMEINEAGKKNVVSSFDPKAVDIEDWVTYEIICKGNHIIHKVNGEVAINLTDNDKNRIRKGRIGLQLHQGEPMKVDFRNIRLKELK
jgi:putative heme-binding domain-containing protein